MQDAGHRRRSRPSVCRARARNSSPASASCSRPGPIPAALLPALLRALGVLLAATAIVLALLARSSAPHAVRIALDLLVIALRRAAPSSASRAPCGSGIARSSRSRPAASSSSRPRGRGPPRLGDDAARRDPHRGRASHTFAGRLLGYGTLTLGDGPSGRDVRFVSDAERVAEAILEANPHGGRTWTQIEGPAVSEQPAPRSRLA